MSPSGGNIDVSFDVNIANAARNLARLERLAEQAQKGIAGAAESFTKEFKDFSRDITSLSDNASKAQNRYVQNLERMGAIAGRTGIEKINAQFDQHIVQIKRQGDAYGQLEGLIKRINVQRQKAIDLANQENKAGGGGSQSGVNLLRGLRDLFEGRTAYGEVQIGKSLMGLSGTTAILGGITAAIAGIGFASFASAKSVAAFGQEIHDVELKTGLTAVQVQRFQFAAKITGQDIGILDRVMRGLTQAIEGTDSKAVRARETMSKMSIDVRSLRDGTMSTMDLFQKLGTSLKEQSNLWVRNAEGIQLMSRAGITSIPAFIEFIEKFKETGNRKFIDDDQVKQFRQINEELTLAGSLWDQFYLRVKGELAKPFIITLKVAMDSFETPKDKLDPATNWVERLRYRLLGVDPEGYVGRPKPGSGLTSSFYSREYDTSRQNEAARYLPGGDRDYYSSLKPGPDRSSDDAAVRRYLASQGPEYRLSEAERKLHELGPVQEYSSKEEVAARRAAEQTVEAAKDAVKYANERKAVVEAIRKSEIDIAERIARPFGRLPAEQKLLEFSLLPTVKGPEVEAQRRKLAPLLADEQQKRADAQSRDLREQAIQTERELMHMRQQAEPVRSMRELGKEATVEDVTRDIEHQHATRMRNAREERDFELSKITERAIDIRDPDAVHKRDMDLAKSLDDQKKQNFKADLERTNQLADVHQKDDDQRRRAEDEIAKIKEKDFAADIKHQADILSKIAETSTKHLRPEVGSEIERRIRLQAADQLYTAEEHRIALNEHGYEAQVSHARNLKAYDEDRNKANEEAYLRLFEIQQRQLDEIKSKTESLFHTLFTSPSQFGSHLGSTLRDAALKPIESGLADTTSRALQPLIASIGGGLGGLFGGSSKTPVTAGGIPRVHVDNFGPGGSAGTSVFNLSSSGGGGGGTISVGGTTISSGGGGGGAPGGAGGMSIPMPSWSPNIFGPAGISGGPGGTGGFAGPVGGGSGGGGGGIGRFGGFAGMLSGLKSAAGFGDVVTGPAGNKWIVTPHGPIMLDSLTGKLSAFGHSQLAKSGAMMGGMALAQQGLLGSQRGTVGGIMEGMLGGAGIGFAIGGGPLGAAIGAGAGLLIGIGEKIAGVETPENESKRLVKGIYRVNIDTDTARQIAGIAQQQYGGHVSMAVRSPEVRNLIMLYSQATGQGNLLSSTVPRAGALQEMGGRLSQMATYANGTPYVYSSSLPVAGGFQSNVWPGGNPSSPIGGGLSLTIGGAGLAQFMNGQIVTPDNIQTQVGSAYMNSNGRVPTAALLSSPGLIIG